MIDLGGAPSASPLNLGTKILQFHEDFWKNLAKLYTGAPWRISARSTGNPGSSPDFYAPTFQIFGRVRSKVLEKTIIDLIHYTTLLTGFWQ